MRKMIILLSAVAAGFLSAGFADSGKWLPAMGCIGYLVFLLIANTIKKAPRGHAEPKNARSKRDSYAPASAFYHTRAGSATEGGRPW